MIQETPYGYVYIITNTVNGKTYIGQHILKNEKWRRYLGSGKLLNFAINKYGESYFVKQFVCYAWNSEELNKLEVLEMLKAKTLGKAEYNIHVGSPAPPFFNPFKNVSEEYLLEMKSKIAEKTKAHWNKIYLDSIQGNETAILKLYRDYRNVRKVANHLGLSQKYVNRFLNDNNVTLNHQTTKGRKLPESTKSAIQKGIVERNLSLGIDSYHSKNCSFCSKQFITKKNLTKYCSRSCSDLSKSWPSLSIMPTKETLENWYRNGASFAMISSKLGKSRANISSAFRFYDIERRKSNNPTGMKIN